MEPLYRRSYVAAELMRAHPPRLSDPNKQLVFALAMAGPPPAGTIEVTRWPAALLPLALEPARTEHVAIAGYYDYAGPSDGVWHVNFADPNLFVAYGSGLLAQDELQCAEHPALGAVREALATDRDLAASRPYGLYGNQFARADATAIRAAVRPHDPPPRSNLIAIAAPVGRGRYTRPTLERILVTAVTGFTAAAHESARRWPGARFELRTGFWGCGAFGGNRELMTLLQLLAAQLAGADRVRFYAFDDAGRADYEAGAAALSRCLAPTLPEVLDRIDDAGYTWGVSNGT